MVLRSCSDFPFANPNFIATVLGHLITYFIYLYEFLLRLEADLTTWLIVTSISFALCVWSLVAVAATDPGDVPVFWGVYDRQNRERKYCMTCHNFKPERSHHCSKCSRCVLNMDHHCPWINNCVGFSNRKYFLLFLLYLNLTLALCLPQMVYLLVREIQDIVAGHRSFNFHTVLCAVAVVVYLMVLLSIGYFCLQHLKMVLSNVTTIEQMLADQVRKVSEEEGKPFTNYNQFDISPWYNFTQVFGENLFIWPLPILDHIPRGRGLLWDRNNENPFCETAHNSRNKP